MLKRNPTRGIQGPRAGRKPEKQWLFPREFERVIACPDAPLDAARGGRGRISPFGARTFNRQADAIGEGKQARRLRDHLWAAGVRRKALHHSTSQALRITFHDLRATGITWAATR